MRFSDIQEEFKIVEKFTCALYEKPKLNFVTEVRLELFLKKYQPKKKEVVISFVKKIDSSFLPPCTSNRTNHTAEKLLSS